MAEATASSPIDTTGGRATAWLRGLSLGAPMVYALFIGLNVVLHSVADNADLWVRLASGKLVVEEHIIPRHDPFTFTVRGREWMDHEWLLGAAMYALNSVSFELLVVVAAVLAVLPFWMMHRLVARHARDDWMLLALVAFAGLVAWRTYAIRPQLVNPIMFVALVWLIDERRRTGSSSVYWAIPLTLLWANLQAGFIIAPAVTAAWLGLSLLERRDRRAAAIVLAGTLVAPLVNAYGWHLYEYTVTASLGENTDRLVVPEWQTPDFHDPLNYPALAGILLLAHFGARSEDAFARVLAIGTLAASLVSARFVPFLALTLIYIVGPQLPDWKLRRRPSLYLAAIGALALAGVAYGIARNATNDPPTGQVPVEALAFLDSEAPGARIYADQSWGSYMTWTGRPAFYDTRTHQVFPESLIAQYHKVERTKGDWQSVLSEWRIEYVLMRGDSDLAEALDASGWRRLYEDDLAAVWARPRS